MLKKQCDKNDCEVGVNLDFYENVGLITKGVFKTIEKKSIKKNQKAMKQTTNNNQKSMQIYWYEGKGFFLWDYITI